MGNIWYYTAKLALRYLYNCINLNIARYLVNSVILIVVYGHTLHPLVMMVVRECKPFQTDMIAPRHLIRTLDQMMKKRIIDFIGNDRISIMKIWSGFNLHREDKKGEKENNYYAHYAAQPAPQVRAARPAGSWGHVTPLQQAPAEASRDSAPAGSRGHVTPLQQVRGVTWLRSSRLLLRRHVTPPPPGSRDSSSSSSGVTAGHWRPVTARVVALSCMEWRKIK